MTQYQEKLHRESFIIAAEACLATGVVGGGGGFTMIQDQTKAGNLYNSHTHKVCFNPQHASYFLVFYTNYGFSNPFNLDSNSALGFCYNYRLSI